ERNRAQEQLHLPSLIGLVKTSPNNMVRIEFLGYRPRLSDRDRRASGASDLFHSKRNSLQFSDLERSDRTKSTESDGLSCLLPVVVGCISCLVLKGQDHYDRLFRLVGGSRTAACGRLRWRLILPLMIVEPAVELKHRFRIARIEDGDLNCGELIVPFIDLD